MAVDPKGSGLAEPGGRVPARRVVLVFVTVAGPVAGAWACGAPLTHLADWNAWTAFLASPWRASLGLTALVLAVLWSTLAAIGARRRRVWVGALVASLLTFPACWAALKGLEAPPTRIRPHQLFAPDEWIPVAPAGSLKVLPPDAVLGWHWVPDGSRVHWRPAALVSPPVRLRTRVPLPADGGLRLSFSLHRWRGRDGRPVRVRCTVMDGNEQQIGEWTRVLRVPEGEEASSRWEESPFDLADAIGPELELIVEADAVGEGAAGSFPPALAISTPSVAAEAAPRGPNCVIILVDALRADRLQCYGLPLENSPHISRLAAQGTLFERVESACSWTVPSVASLFTGTYTSTHGMLTYTHKSRLSLPTLAEQFRDAGARTLAVSANVLINPIGGFGRGFDEFAAASDHEDTRPLRGAWVTDEAITLLRLNKGKRFFLYLHYMDVHDPYDPPEGWGIYGQARHESYLGEIRYCDSEIGRFLAALDALGRASDTLVVLIADHGEAFMEHGVNGHGFTVHREEVRVPLILRYPGGVPAGRRVRSLVRSIDAYTTIAELAGLQVTRHVEGESLLPLLRGEAPERDRIAFSELLRGNGPRVDDDPVVSVSDGRHKFITYLQEPRQMLYDIRSDPNEQADLADQKPDLVASLERRIRRFLRQRNGPKTPDRPLTEAEKARLKALGYLDPSGD